MSFFLNTRFLRDSPSRNRMTQPVSNKTTLLFSINYSYISIVSLILKTIYLTLRAQYLV